MSTTLNNMSGHYDDKYWEFQSKIGKIGGFLNKFKFEGHVNISDVIMDFGCGGGFLLNELEASHKIGF